ncbi:MAG: hypothetical protein JXB47_10420 [Anaerolineae bacterium]|nr:hypothetical protein [Anaerolineae bacterium]
MKSKSRSQSEAKLEALKEQLAAQLLEDESLTDELDDEDADMLIKWGLAQIEALVARAHTAGKSPKSAASREQHEADLDTQTKQIRQIMKRINRLVGQRALLDPEEIETKFVQLLEMSTALPLPTPDEPEKEVEAEPAHALSAAELSDAEMSSSEILRRLLAQITPGPDAQQEEKRADGPTTEQQ